MENKKGCVYFFKHVGLSPIKIGYSENESPYSRFCQFKTYAPFGSECLGFIITANPNELERELHRKFISSRLEGEWFDISVEEVEKVINNYSTREQLREISDFQIYYMKMKQLETETNINKKDITLLTSSEKKQIFINELNKNVKLNKSQFANTYKISRQTLNLWFRDYKKNKQ